MKTTFPSKAKKKYYIVKKGKNPGVYYNWPDCQKQVQGFTGAVFKGFAVKKEAEEWLGRSIEEAPVPSSSPLKREVPSHSGKEGNTPSLTIENSEKLYPPHIRFSKDISFQGEISLPEKIIIYTDGSCLVNPNGSGGFAAVFLDEEENELFCITGGEPASTNNRMELRAAYEALKAADTGVPHSIVFHTDSKYLQQAFTKGWIRKWKKNGWKTVQGSAVLNQDLWKGLDRLMEKQTVDFQWVKGHVGTAYNELCDRLAKEEAKKFL